MRKLMMVAALTASSFIAGSAQAANIVETASQAGTFQTLIAAAKAAGLAGALSSGKQLTVFAPTDEAFAKLPDGTVETLLKPENKDKLVAILTYHVIPGKIMSGDIAGKTKDVKTVQGDTLAVDATNGVKVDEATVVNADIAASNGVIHVIDTVVMPN